MGEENHIGLPRVQKTYEEIEPLLKKVEYYEQFIKPHEP